MIGERLVAFVYTLSMMIGTRLEDSAISTALQTAFNQMKTDILGYIVVILPIALAIVGAIIGIRYAVKFFKQTSKG